MHRLTANMCVTLLRNLSLLSMMKHTAIFGMSEANDMIRMNIFSASRIKNQVEVFDLVGLL